VLFADVVHSMDIAAAVGAERLREIMAELVDRATAVVQRYGGTVDKFTGDGIMAVFGAPMALEDHAVRGCLAAVGVQGEAKRLAVKVRERDGVAIELRVGLNSGQVIAGEVGSKSLGYTTIGEQVGVAQRMESVAPPGGVMLSTSTARLVDGAAALGEPELVQIKGADEPVVAHRLLGMGERRRAVERAESHLVGRRWEMAAMEGLLERAIDGHGAVVAVVGSPGIGKSRLAREVAAMAAAQGVEVFTAFCESHTSDIPFHVVARLLRAATGVGELDGQAARTQVRARAPDADPEDLALFDDLLGIADPEVAMPEIDPDAGVVPAFQVGAFERPDGGDLGRVAGVGQGQQEVAVGPSRRMLGGVEGQATPRRHLLKPAQLPVATTPPARREGGRGRDAGLGAHQRLREGVVLGQPPIEGLLGQRSIPHAREEGVNSGRLPRGAVAAHQRIGSHGLSVGSVEEPQFAKQLLCSTHCHGL